MGIVYILTNEAMPGYIKVGRTQNLKQRLKGLYHTSVPLPFECFYAAEVEDSVMVERRIHDAFSDTRTSKSREFFEIAPERVMSAIKLVEIRDVTPSEDYIENKEDGAALLRAKKRAPFAGFSSVGIPIKSILSFSKDETETCVVFSEKTVMYKDEELSLSAAGGKVLCSKFGWSQESGVNGLLFWMYEGENIFNRRIRLEEENA